MKVTKEPQLLDFLTYQERALSTDQNKEEGLMGMMIPLLGLAGEVGSLTVEYKKKIRDKEKHVLFTDRVEADLGDILWYLSNVASRSGLSLDVIAQKNLHKLATRWSVPHQGKSFFLDDEIDPAQQLPRHFAVEFRLRDDGRVQLSRDGQPIGDPLTDNNYLDDGYRFHDVFHLAYAAVLGWSPVIRKLLGCKRRGNSEIDEVEDGGRAAVCEEGVSALVYSYARTRTLLAGVNEIDHDILRMISALTGHLEVRVRTPAEWQRAILVGYRVWHQVRAANGGVVTVDLNNKDLFFATLPRANPARTGVRSGTTLNLRKTDGKPKAKFPKKAAQQKAGRTKRAARTSSRRGA
jgi:hypothetical protein